MFVDRLLAKEVYGGGDVGQRTFIASEMRLRPAIFHQLRIECTKVLCQTIVKILQQHGSTADRGNIIRVQKILRDESAGNTDINQCKPSQYRSRMHHIGTNFADQVNIGSVAIG